MSTATERTGERYEERLTAPLLSEEALMLLDPNSFRIEQAYYEHGFDRFTFTIKTLEYSIPACILSLPTLYFVGFSRAAASEIYAKFQTTPIVNIDPYISFVDIAKDHLYRKRKDVFFHRPNTTRAALDYMGISDEAQTHLLKLRYPQPMEFMLRHILVDDVSDWVLRYFDCRIGLLLHLDYEIKQRGDTEGGNVVPVDLEFLADEIENKYMDSDLLYGEYCLNWIHLSLNLITDLS